MNNLQRALVAESTLDDFSGKMGLDGEDIETKMSDLLTYFRHLSDKEGFSMEEVLEQSLRSYDADLNLEADNTDEKPLDSGLISTKQLALMLEESQAIDDNIKLLSKNSPGTELDLMMVRDIVAKHINVDLIIDTDSEHVEKSLVVLEYMNNRKKELERAE